MDKYLINKTINVINNKRIYENRMKNVIRTKGTLQKEKTYYNIKYNILEIVELI